MEHYLSNVDGPVSDCDLPKTTGKSKPTASATYSSGSASRNPAVTKNVCSAVWEGKSSSRRPVFVTGCPRSGTTLLQHMMLSAGDFALFPEESDAFSFLGTKFRNLSSLKKRRQLLKFFL